MELKNLFIISLITLFLIGGFIVSVSAENAYDDQYIDGLNVSFDLEQSLKDAKLENKTVMIIFDQSSCVYCEILKENTLTDSKVQDVINEKYIPTIVDVNKNPMIASYYNVYGTPTMVFVSGDEDFVYQIDGYLDPEEFLDELNQIE
ncbi:thioredoxin family protein [uncultured Methanobrevibacter sp.]|uniref:thioredoxin family protein n=1 Tax=uncultured Methanobrevibacter sp. TaxID=253161 RepID=UPI0026360322|nr:thioredoxin family protein [uncultured Methanobrevibacter sp.]